MNKENSYEVEYMYDESADILGIKVTRDFTYHETIELDEGLLLDFDEDNVPTALEMHDASKRLNVSKNSLKKIIFCKMKVIVDTKSISINAIFGVKNHNKENKHELESFTSNNYNIPNMETNLVTI
ncbi:DUF2283 domain-containing protein [uncultured Methanobrevibacter sp.]|uniref:DUF2283 domain-containing protein n=1 Tax=uncultured Methanobrevibacter sp. TaxID=253161 RepID=UPI0025F881A9|nr:DUF2283 domain-containing protein [uncultured Methanobrevibacter sp.]